MIAMAFKCFSCVLQVFQSYVASVSAVLDVCCKYFYLDVTKVDLVCTCYNETHLLQLTGRRRAGVDNEGCKEKRIDVELFVAWDARMA
jgi:hypothetical protein